MIELYTRIACADSVELTVVLAGGSGLAAPFARAGAKTVETRARTSPYSRWIGLLNKPARMASSGSEYDIFAAETFPLPPVRNIPIALTVHDLRFVHRQWVSFFRHWFGRRIAGASLARAGCVIVVSDSIKKEMAAVFPEIDGQRIHVVSNGVPTTGPAGPADQKTAFERLGIDQPYVLYLGHIESRKNIELLKKAFLIFRGKSAGAGDILLVLAGSPVKKRGSRIEKIEKGDARTAAGIINTGKVSGKDRAALLRSASLVVQPSMYEGFGMGVLEAMAIGIPVACSAIPAHMEVCGQDGALLFSPDSAEEAADCIGKGVFDKKTRTALVESGKKRASKFSWEDSARRLIGIWKGLKG